MIFNFSSLGRAPIKTSWHSFSCVMRAPVRDTRPRHADPIGAAAAQPPAGSGGGRMPVAGNWVRGRRTMENNIPARPREQDNGYAVPSPICAAPRQPSDEAVWSGGTDAAALALVGTSPEDWTHARELVTAAAGPLIRETLSRPSPPATACVFVAASLVYIRIPPGPAAKERDITPESHSLLLHSSTASTPESRQGRHPPEEQPKMSHHHISRPRGNTSASSTSTTSSSSDLDLDAITPCPPHSHPNALLDAETDEAQTQPQSQRRPSNHHHRKQRPTSWRSTLSLAPSTSSSSSSEQDTATTSPSAGEPEATDPETLWRRMLALQRTLGCYNSARMRAALEQENPEEGGGVRMFPFSFPRWMDGY